MTHSPPNSPRRPWAHRSLLGGLALALLAVSCGSDSGAEPIEDAVSAASTPSAESAVAPAEQDPEEEAEDAAEAPRNDLLENVVVIDPAALPFTDSVDTSGATSDSDDPTLGCDPPWDASIWYSITPTSDERMLLSGFGTDYPFLVTVAKGEPGSFESIGCRPFSRVIEFEANATYYLLVSDDGGGNGGNAVFTVDALPEAPQNDLLENATVIDPAALPFTDSVDTTGAGNTSSDDGQFGCDLSPGSAATVWYSITPTNDMTLSLSSEGTDYSSAIGVSEADATRGFCQRIPFDFEMTADVTYWIQVFDGQEDGGGNGGNLEFSVEEVTE
jgi:hypothetical protein